MHFVNCKAAFVILNLALWAVNVECKNVKYTNLKNIIELSA